MAVAISASHFARFLPHRALFPSSSRKIPPAIARRMASEKSINAALSAPPPPSSSSLMIFDSHLHVWASPQEASEKYPYHPGKEPTIPGDAAFLLECMAEAGVDGALVVQPINHMFDHSYVTTVLKMYPSKFIGCCLANPAEDGSGIAHLEQLILKDGYRAIRFNPYIWPSGQKMTNDIGKVLFSKAGELGAPVGILCMKCAA
uniref:Dihydrodipicolinate synthase n=1 Tax=Anthurium amnicola TaxID=1678845 RepID=A0A1D1YJJ2_9ARAE